MNCVNCGTYLTDPDLEYCPRCGCNVLIQKKVDYLSKYYYNQGLEKATIRDLSGAITCLKQSLTYNKANIDARNLLGLVYFETGEVVAALSEWVISKNLRPNKNLASEYINKLQANPNKLEAINETIRKYNHALALCREGHEDMAAIQLKKILAQNSKLIKGYHLLALIWIKDKEWNKARRILKKAARIDKTNTTTLRFLKEIDEQTGVTTRLDRQEKGFFFGGTGGKKQEEEEEGSLVVRQPMYKERSRIPLFFMLLLGFAAGAAALWFLAVPAIRQGIYREANQQLVQYSEALASQGAELTRAQGEAQQSDNAAEEVAQQIDEEKKRSQSYQSLLNAYMYMQEGNLDGAALEVQNVHESVLDDTAMGAYTTVCYTTGVTGITEEEEMEEGEDGSGEDTGEESTETGSMDGSYTDSSDTDSGYTDGSYVDSGYADGGYTDGSYVDSGYTDSGYTGGSYTDNSYTDGSYTDNTYTGGYADIGGYGY